MLIGNIFLSKMPYVTLYRLIKYYIMKSIEDLKKEQYDAKAKLHELIEVMNSEDFYKLSSSEMSLIGQQRTGLEMYVSSLTRQIYGKQDMPDASGILWLSMLYGMMNTSSGFGQSSTSYSLKDELHIKDFEDKSEEDESGHDD